MAGSEDEDEEEGQDDVTRWCCDEEPSDTGFVAISAHPV